MKEHLLEHLGYSETYAKKIAKNDKKVFFTTKPVKYVQNQQKTNFEFCVHLVIYGKRFQQTERKNKIMNFAYKATKCTKSEISNFFIF